MNPKIKNTPKKIYLQIGDDINIDDFDKLSGVTWCEDNINKSDIEYVLKDSICPKCGMKKPVNKKLCYGCNALRKIS